MCLMDLSTARSLLLSSIIIPQFLTFLPLLVACIALVLFNLATNPIIATTDRECWDLGGQESLRASWTAYFVRATVPKTAI